MAPTLGDIWGPFHRSEDRPNGSHHCATHWRCIDTFRPANAPINIDIADKLSLMKNEEWFDKALQDAVDASKSCNGEKTAMAGHLQKKIAEKRKLEKTASDVDGNTADDEAGGSSQQGAKRKKVDKSFTQSKLEVFRGLDIPFSEVQKDAIHEQFLRATQSANLPEHWVEDPEILKLFIMFRGRALDVIPTRAALVSRRENVLMSTDGVRTVAKDNVAGVMLSHKFKSLLIDTLRTNNWKKDGASLAVRFGEMIDKAERVLGCNVAGFLTDNDGGSKRGRNDLGVLRPWLLLFACCAHQGQLILGEYIRENEEAAKLFEKLIEFVHWLNNHDKVRDIFDAHQRALDPHGKVLTYLVANLTHWTTHLVAALRFQRLKEPIRRAILNDREDIIKAQVGAETRTRQKAALRRDAIEHCESVELPSWWDRLESVVVDMERICYLTNIAQSDHVRPDQFLLAFAGLYRHFLGHENTSLGKQMCKRLEKRWKEMDQAVFILALVLNPFEMLSRFGNKANIDIFILAAEISKLYIRVNSRPSTTPLTPEQEANKKSALEQRACQVTTAFMAYLSGTGAFALWSNADSANTTELANFALLLLYLVANQAGLERSFSDFLNKKNKKRARLGLQKMTQQSKVTRRIREDQYAEGLRQKRDGRKNHSEVQIKTLLAVPRYADANISDTDSDDTERPRESVLVSSCAAWRKQVAAWQSEIRDADDSDSDTNDTPQTAAGGRRRAAWLPIQLDKLFGGDLKEPMPRPSRAAVSEEGLYMELLVAEHSGEEPDDGELEGSGDDYLG
ncbi:ribonuclease H-like domain-containing protein [Mycena albidolilacea]|uniref:Ribonuclease H-like domain-containing protein n=1 Tax=Mycena albidolilacea TaxID=1033008 RepID=A0AAD6ZJL6_9AGAR|nr:ribonuclease H-like domain-containing protein [Mycena albidolilacea]